MFGLFRAGRMLAAATLLASLFAAPALAADSGAIDTFDNFSLPASASAPVQQSAAPVVQPTSSQFAPQASSAPAHVTPQVSGPGFQSQDVAVQQAVAIAAVPPIITEPAKPRSLSDLVISFVDYGDQDEAEECLAKAVYFEARSEPLEGQLAVAEVVLNRADSGRYPPDVCSVVTQPAQFSFIRGGKFPRVNESDAAWRRALAIADIAMKKLAKQVESNVLWYHATYVAPSWGRRLTRVATIGTHIFYN